MNKRLVIIVEGYCELQFMDWAVIPYLYSMPSSDGWAFNAQSITTNRILNKKGGNCNFELLRNEVMRVAAQKEPWITTFLDFFRIPTNFPGYNPNNPNICEITSAMKKEITYSRFIPYIQNHEFETLLFANISAFRELSLCDSQMGELEAICNKYPHIEDINGGTTTSPSKRLANVFRYQKRLHSGILIKKIPIQTMMDKAPGFKGWIDSICSIMVNPE